MRIIDSEVDRLGQLAAQFDLMAARPHQTAGEIYRLKQLAKMHRDAQAELLVIEQQMESAA